MATGWMVVGVDKTQTGSLDSAFDAELSVNNYNYAYIGGAVAATSATYTWPTGSNKNVASRDLQMYTPYPSGTERGKLYFITVTEFVTNPPLFSDKYVGLEQPPGNQFYVVTPSLNAVGLVNTQHIAIYAFDDVDDLFANGWRCQRGAPGASDPLAAEGTWNSIVNSLDWLNNVGLDINDPTPETAAQAKAQIVACTLAYTPQSFSLQVGLGLSAANLIKGAVVVAGEAVEPWGASQFAAYGGIVPFTG